MAIHYEGFLIPGDLPSTLDRNIVEKHILNSDWGGQVLPLYLRHLSLYRRYGQTEGIHGPGRDPLCIYVLL